MSLVPIETLSAVSVLSPPDNNNVDASISDKKIIDSKNRSQTSVKKNAPKSESEDVKMSNDVRSSQLKDQGQSKGVTSDESSVRQVKPMAESDQKKNSIMASSVESKEQDEKQSSSETKVKKHSEQKVSKKPKNLPSKNQSSNKTEVKEGAFTLVLLR